MKALPYGRNIKNVPGGAHLGGCPSLLCRYVSRHLELMRRYRSLPGLTGLVSVCKDHFMFYLFIFFFWYNAALIVSIDAVPSKRMYLIYPLLCFNRTCGRLIVETQISLWNNKQCGLIATVPATEQKQFLPKYAANDWVSPSSSESVCMCLCVCARL